MTSSHVAPVFETKDGIACAEDCEGSFLRCKIAGGGIEHLTPGGTCEGKRASCVLSCKNAEQSVTEAYRTQGGASPAEPPTSRAGGSIAEGPPRLELGPRDPSLVAVSSEELVRRLDRAHRELEVKIGLAVSAELITRGGLSEDDLAKVYFVRGSMHAILDDLVEAEKVFRVLLALRPAYDPLAETSPKILAPFRKAQADERARQDAVKRAEREAIARKLAFIGAHPAKAASGESIHFNYRMRDPDGVVSRLIVHYRRTGEQTYSSLVLRRSAAGEWGGEIPAVWTTSQNSFAAEYYVTAMNAEEEVLLSAWEPEAPNRVLVASSGRSSHFYEQTWFWVVVGVLAVASVTSRFVFRGED